MIDYEFYYKNPEKIDGDLIIASRQDSKGKTGLLLRSYHLYLDKCRKHDRRVLETQSL